MRHFVPVSHFCLCSEAFIAVNYNVKQISEDDADDDYDSDE